MINNFDNITLPEEVKNNKNYRVYIKYTMDGRIAAMFDREVDKRDGREPAIIDGQQSSLPVFYGEWRRVPQDEVDKINAENEKLKKTQAINRARLREQELEEMEKLLAALKSSVAEDSDLDELDMLSDLTGGVYEDD